MATTGSGGRPRTGFVVSRPTRADARRNFDALLDAAREVFAAEGAGASLEGIARRAGVNIATLYRNFPTRQHLFETVYLDEVEALGRLAAEPGGLGPWDALESWLRQFVSYATTKKAIYDAIAHRAEMFATGRDMIHAAGRPLLERAQAAGKARTDVSFDDVLFLVNGVSGANFVQEAQRDRVLAMALDGIKAPG
ncbi:MULTISPECIES: TetR/AcrR family transcriptional regulator [Streptomyces]|jgi:AcrR family transcriptional regulator|uniref:TetR family transcriptional regulator n=3 Tax=Streptomyces griseoaurantiacus TaxID=68213 RepID=F3NDE0_9ACTN|nr:MULTISPECIES: TetR/AcrR family transcriptional regulator [Streptomyces]EGG48577.1 tetR family transcriptional regulator [Streptomyces griseoaurantiacus M045]MBA5224970.1 TetR/AcrR family transcriptional regulator [Streptomyces griseoaurantiacus]MDX3088599.1 helix-turn-helix domain containing protein [Streptomyces sp. ME12-02E]MDX3331885.1 helix-turn-helix domain containing protein [Streptomyces sp. ME02-6978a]MDX3358495.1 helix-turn-helix domain containing protein [Streptomyces sp. ME02-697